MAKKTVRRRFVSQHQLSRDQALWLCRAILTHYRRDGKRDENERDQFDILNRSHKSTAYKRGRDWVLHPVGYDLNEVIYGSEESGIREAWASLVSLPVSRALATPMDYRTYQTYGLVQGNFLTVAVYRITEVTVMSSDQNFVSYVKDCFARLQDDVEEVPEYVSTGKEYKGDKDKDKKGGQKRSR